MTRQARFGQLRQVVFGGSLASEELRYLKILLSRVNTDIIGELPIELVGQIAELLDLHVFIACLRVSRRWRDKLLSVPVIVPVMNKYRPSLRQSGDSQVDPDQYLKILHKIGRSRWGYFQSNLAKPFSWRNESYFRLDPLYYQNHQEDILSAYERFGGPSDDPELDGLAYLRALYSHGKIAWLAKQRIVVVDNLRSRARKLFKVSTGPLVGPTLQLLAFGDKLIVGSMDRLLIAWDHEAYVCQEKKLPGSIKDATTDGSRVAVVLFNGDVLLWEFGGKLLTIETASLMTNRDPGVNSKKSWTSNLRVIFHPTCSRTLFLASGYTDLVDSKAIMKRVVYEFSDTTHVKTYEFELPASIHNRVDLADVEVEVRKVLPYRRDIIGFCEQYEPPDPRFITCYETFVEFDIYDRKFTARIREKFDHRNFGWRAIHTDADLDFEVRFRDNGFSAYSYQAGFDFNALK
ncbi:hypothetical protein F5Y04DRAFT_268840 [Hypomontagnella monticulosa]|nr:hypothetical protein F5Y04DRAFT_268840 [Hypomontagnella monticulosa]